MEKFKTIMNNESFELEEKKSKFIAEVYYVENLEQVEDILKNIKKKYFDAKHYCYAYRLIENKIVKSKQSDDGEPSGTAGAPIFNLIDKNELYNVLIVVTRYFGGILLGTGGLVRAYSQSSANALEKAQIAISESGVELQVKIEYKDLDKFKYYAEKHSIVIKQILYEENIICILELNNEEKEKLINKNQEELEILESVVLKEKYIKTKTEK